MQEGPEKHSAYAATAKSRTSFWKGCAEARTRLDTITNARARGECMLLGGLCTDGENAASSQVWRLGEGSAATRAIPLRRSAAANVAEMGTPQEAMPRCLCK